ncbi:hypothetical protein ZOD2009_15306 [Haladaptatus paucihalophilus DX253]|uniref:Uncharacterized protein n=1 Tax=Haladaptatus paucihalophilus DX253 TaxID=797209 RepID=E7QW73_HALPU|nr:MULTISPECIES: hypothetical protein [Haladaptatus]EFW91207.1 hypothetical protein ZOD2009_15306 [Haladaptatus paucihalophilus DX253]SHL65383.1 hypothetical protein SAMN05444342_4333 [Haladaptatus paucihalophilus DX253]
MLGQTGRFWVGAALFLIGAVLLFENFVPGVNAPLILVAIGVLVLAVGTLIIAVARRQRPV